MQWLLIPFAGYLAGGEFLEEIGEGIDSNPDRGIPKDHPGLVAVRRRVVIVGDESGSQMSDQAGVAELVLLVVAPANESPADSVQGA